MITKKYNTKKQVGGARQPKKNKIPGMFSRARTYMKSKGEYVRSLSPMKGLASAWEGARRKVDNSRLTSKGLTFILSAPKRASAKWNSWRSKKTIESKVGIHLDTVKKKYTKKQAAITKTANQFDAKKEALFKKYQKRGLNIGAGSKYQKELDAAQKKFEAATAKQTADMEAFLAKKEGAVSKKNPELALQENILGMAKNSSPKGKFNKLAAMYRLASNANSSTLGANKQAATKTLTNQNTLRQTTYQTLRQKREAYDSSLREISDLKTRIKTYGYKADDTGKNAYTADRARLGKLQSGLQEQKTGIATAKKDLQTADAAFKKARNAKRSINNQYSKETVAGREARITRAQNVFQRLKTESNKGIAAGVAAATRGYGEPFARLGAPISRAISAITPERFRGKSAENIEQKIETAKFKTKSASANSVVRTRNRLDVLQRETARRLEKTRTAVGQLDYEGLGIKRDEYLEPAKNKSGLFIPTPYALTNLDRHIQDKLNQYQALKSSTEQAAELPKLQQLRQLRSYLKNYANLEKINLAVMRALPTESEA